MDAFNYFNENETFAALSEQNLAISKQATSIFEAAEPAMAAVEDFGNQQTRAAAMALVLGWVEGGDFSFAAINDGAVIMADADGDEEITEEEDAYLNELLQATAEALVSTGADSGNVTSFLDDEDDDAGAKIGEFLKAKMDTIEIDDETLISNYAVNGDIVLESIVKVVRAGKIVLKKKRIGRPHKLTSLQRAGLKKARTKAFTGAARIARKKSMRIRQKRGL